MLFRTSLLALALGLSFGAFGQASFFDEADAFFQQYVKVDKIDYQAIQQDDALAPLLQQIAEPNPENWSDADRKAFYINAYNLLVIEGVLEHYPIASVQDVMGFFDRKRYDVSGRSLTLNELEKDVLFGAYPDPRLHFVLVCGALGCPPIIPAAYRPENLEQHIEQQTRIALNNPGFIQVRDSNEVSALSQIFRWYAQDFGKNESEILAYINGYRTQPLPSAYRVEYYSYDWSLNASEMDPDTEGIATNAARYVVSATVPKNTSETKIFNNLYSQRTRDERATFFTTITSFVYGVTHRLNVGFDLRYRVVRYGAPTNFPLGAFANPTRQGITTLGPKVRIAPVKKWSNFSIQSALWFPIGEDLTGRAGTGRFIDWDGPTWWTQFFNDFPIGQRFSLFTEIDLMWEDIGSQESGRANRVSTPVTVIGSFFPNPKTTLYVLGSYSPFWQQNFDYFFQTGVGTKYQFTPNLELELSYTYFSNQFLLANMGHAGTYNLGLRFNL